MPVRNKDIAGDIPRGGLGSRILLLWLSELHPWF